MDWRKRVINYLLIANFTIITPVIGLHIKTLFFAQKVNQSNLEQLLNEEKQKLGLENVNINVSFGKAYKHIAHSQKISENHYSIVLDYGKNVNTLRHELRHIHIDRYNLGDAGSILSEAKCFLYENFDVKP